LDSIISQTYREFEVILVDDGSKDKSGKICDDFALKDDRIRVIHQENGGVSKARYNGILASKGDWAFFVDADDYLPIDALHSLICRSEGYEIISGELKIVDENHQLTSLSNRIKEIGTFTREELVNSLLTGTRIPNLPRMLISMPILKKQLVSIDRKVRIFEDFLLSLSIYLGTSKAKGIPQTVYYYRMNEGSTVHTYEQTIEDADTVDEYIEKLLDNQKEFSHALFKHRIIELKRFIHNSHIEKSRLFLKANVQAAQCEKSKGDMIVLALCKIKFVALRRFLWSLFKYFSRIKGV